jgi:flagellar M-ring protein FliF
MALVLGTSLVLLCGLLISVLNSRITYGTLYTDLAPEDASAIVQELKKRNIPHRVEAAGTAIMVPDADRHTLRLELASDGLPRGGSVGFELFDRAQLGATEFEQQVSLRRALEGELSRSISAVEGVKSARVHLVLPERRLFAMRKDSASASVVVKLLNPGSFGKREVSGIVHLVSSAVPGLSRERVSLVSTEGVTLHRPSGDGSALGAMDGSDARAEQERTVAVRLEQEVREQLERVVGPGNADVRINVLLDAAVTERTEEYWDRDTTALRSEHLVEEGVGTTEAGVAGVPGARTNLPDAIGEGEEPAEELGGALGAGTRRARTRNWEVDRVTEKTSLPSGGIQRLSVAVLLNGEYQGEGGQFVPRSPDQVQSLEQIVRRAVGLSEERGDTILVQAAQFARMAPVDDIAPEPMWWLRYIPYAAASAAILFVLCALILVWRSRGKNKAHTAELERAQQVIRELEASEPHQALKGQAARRLDAPAREQVRELALDLAAKDPASAAVVLKKWLSTGEGRPTAG